MKAHKLNMKKARLARKKGIAYSAQQHLENWKHMEFSGDSVSVYAHYCCKKLSQMNWHLLTRHLLGRGREQVSCQLAAASKHDRLMNALASVVIYNCKTHCLLLVGCGGACSLCKAMEKYKSICFLCVCVCVRVLCQSYRKLVCFWYQVSHGWFGSRSKQAHYSQEAKPDHRRFTASALVGWEIAWCHPRLCHAHNSELLKGMSQTVSSHRDHEISESPEKNMKITAKYSTTCSKGLRHSRVSFWMNGALGTANNS